MKYKILLLLSLLLITSCATNTKLPVTYSYCGYQEYQALSSVGLPGAVDILIVTREPNKGAIHYTNERRKVYNIYCQGRIDTLKVEKIVEQNINNYE